MVDKDCMKLKSLAKKLPIQNTINHGIITYETPIEKS